VPSQKFGLVSGDIQITASKGLRNVYSPTHQLDVTRSGENSARATFETKDNDNDLQLFYGISDSDFGLSLLTYREAGKDGYFLLQLSPREKVAENELIDKDIVFVVDTSGSMADAGKLDKAQAALNFGIRGLNPGDRFNVISFAGEEHLMEPRPIEATAQGKDRGVNYVKSLKPSGGTNINDALTAAMKQFEASERPKLIVFMTDGLPTVGESNVDNIIRNIKTASVSGSRLFTFGVGYDVNTRLLDGLAAQNSGAADYVEPKEDIETKVSNFFTKVSSPVLTDIALDLGRLDADLVYPRQLPDIFKGTQVTLIGRYRNDDDLSDLTIKLTGRRAKENRTYEYSALSFPLRTETNDFLPRLWATRRVGWLVDQIRSNGENTELRNEIVDLGTRFGIVTPYTSYLATDGNESNAPMARMRADAQMGAMKQASGSGSVTLSKDTKKMREELSVADEAGQQVATIRKVGSKTFYRQGEVWTDAEAEKNATLPVIRIVFGSDVYYKLVSDEPQLARFLALGKEVNLVWKGKLYKIVK
jgi:Ca-activated chloride channel family protein